MPSVIWITGLPGSGKSTVADAFRKRNPGFHILRMDEFRKVVTPEPTFSDTERDTVYRAMVYAAMELSGLGHDVIIDATGNRRAWRELARRLIPRFYEVYLKCPVRVCEERERARKESHGAPRGIYEKARGGWPVPGVTVPYEEPAHPDMAIDAEKTAPEEAALQIERLLAEK